MVLIGRRKYPPIYSYPQTSRPKTVAYSIENKRMAAPEFIIDEVEKGLTKGTEILLPGAEAKLLMWARRKSPRLPWKVIHLSDRRQGALASEAAINRPRRRDSPHAP